MEIFGYEVGEVLIRSTIYFFITFFVGVFLLHIATKILDFKNRSIGKAISVIIVGDIVAFILAFIPYIGRIIGLIGF